MSELPEVLRPTALVIALTLVPSVAAADPPVAFPGAEGFGAIATGGRGGRVIKVTTLATDGPGSLQAALDTAGARIVVFDVSGVIEGDQVIRHSDVTIAGQTAPGGGITIAGRLVGRYDYAVQNVIVQHVRIRPGPPGQIPGNQLDGVQLSRQSRVLLDHVSVAFGVDETVDLYEADDVTVQWSTITSSATSGHPEGQHNYGLISGPDGHRISVHHTLMAHHKNRSPAIANGPAEIRNNVIYNVRHGFVHHNPASGQFDIVGNYYRRGPSDALFPFYFDDEAGGAAPNLSYHLSDNYIDDPGAYVGFVHDPWAAPDLHPSFADLFLGGGFYSPTPHDFTEAQADHAAITTTDPESALEQVLACAGAFPRDAVTLAAIRDVSTRGGAWGAHRPADLMQGLTPSAPAPDGDGDGMPDAWELARGLDPSDGSDHAVVSASGFTAIEDYLIERASALVPPGCPRGAEETNDPPPEDGPIDSDPDAGAPDQQPGDAGSEPDSAGGVTPDAGGGAYDSRGCQAHPTGGVSPLLALLAIAALRRRRGLVRSDRS